MEKIAIIQKHFGRLAVVLTMAVSLLFGACTKDQDTVSLRVEADYYHNISKAYVDSHLCTCWANGDTVIINGASKYIVISNATANPTCYIHNVDANNNYWSVYPASIAASASYDQSEGTLNNLSLPSTQVYFTDPSGRQMVPTVMTAWLGSRTGTINYYNACIALQLTLTNNYSKDLLLSKVVVSDNNAPLNGSFKITGANGSTPDLEYDGTSITDDNKSVTLNIPNGLNLPTNGTALLYVILPPTDDYDGNKFTVEITAMNVDDINSNRAVTIYEFSHTQSSSASGQFQRNLMAPINILLDEPHTLVLNGIGTEANPYRISTAEELQSMQNLVNKGYDPIGEGMPFASAYYQLENSISGTADDPIQLAGPIGTATNNFTGHFNGQNFSLSNLSLSTGLFGHVSQGATISNLTVDGASVSASGSSAAGVICARADGSVIDHCQVSGSISFSDMPSSVVYVGGIVGDMVAASSLLNCHNGASISVSGSSSSHRVGGIAGHLIDGTIYNSYAMSQTSLLISAPNAYVGGIVGRADGASLVLNCYLGWANTLSGGSNLVADICSELGSNVRLSKCYYPQKAVAVGEEMVDNLHQVLPIDNSSYQVSGTSLLNLLNQTVTSIGTDLGLLSWSSSSDNAPILSYSSSK